MLKVSFVSLYQKKKLRKFYCRFQVEKFSFIARPHAKKIVNILLFMSFFIFEVYLSRHMKWYGHVGVGIFLYSWDYITFKLLCRSFSSEAKHKGGLKLLKMSNSPWWKSFRFAMLLHHPMKWIWLMCSLWFTIRISCGPSMSCGASIMKSLQETSAKLFESSWPV